MSPFSLTPNAQPAHQPAFQTQVFHSKESLFALAAKKRTQTHDFFFSSFCGLPYFLRSVQKG
jgi:hypothetical protein